MDRELRIASASDLRPPNASSANRATKQVTAIPMILGVHIVHASGEFVMPVLSAGHQSEVAMAG
ncbi:MAG: hypothetical protein M3468_06460 [Acidobacteriota bacterium]|nr:hypothetical protein [Acidobacteriota bacterium]